MIQINIHFNKCWIILKILKYFDEMSLPGYLNHIISHVCIPVVRQGSR